MKMKKSLRPFMWLLIISIIVVFFFAGCKAEETEEVGKEEVVDNVNGTWNGQITENDKSTLVQVVLRDQQGSVEGEFIVLSETGQDIDEGMTFQIVQTEYISNKLKFIVPITGEVDDDALAFELLINGDCLKGDVYELREGSEKIPITFIKQVTDEPEEEALDESEAEDVDTTPPKIYSVSIKPTVVKNGDTFDIVTKVSEAGLDVTADISDLDSSKTTTIILKNEAGGTYKGKVIISAENETGNGMKKIRVNAVDSSGNTSTLLVEVQLKNPADALDKVPPDDNFDGTVLDVSKWKPDNSGGGVVKQDGRLIVSTNSKPAFSSARVQSVWEFTGDFDFQVDFQIGEGWSRPAKDHLDGATLGVLIAGQSYHITRIRRDYQGSNNDVLFAWSSAGFLITKEIPSNVLSGKYRLVRAGTTLTLLYDIGSGWQELTNGTVPLGPAKAYLGNGSINASHAFTTYFDNFRINSGVTTYKPWAP